MTQKIAIIIVSYHTGAVLFECLAAALSQNNLGQIIIVNNGNPKDTLDKLQALQNSNPKISIIGEGVNIGFGAACNLGAKHSNYSRLIFLNPDAILENDETAKLLCDNLDNSPKIIGGLIIDENGIEQRGARRGTLSLFSALVSFLGLGKSGENMGIWRDFNQYKEPLPNMPIEISTISGAFFAISANDFANLGGFDEGYFLHVEDIDLCHRLRNKLGGKVIFDPRAKARHIGATSNAPKPFIIWHKYKGFIRYFWKTGNLLEKAALIFIAPILFFAMFGASFIKPN